MKYFVNITIFITGRSKSSGQLILSLYLNGHNREDALRVGDAVKLVKEDESP